MGNNLVIIKRTIDTHGNTREEVFNFEQMWETGVHFVFKVYDTDGWIVYINIEKRILLESVLGDITPPQEETS